MQFFNLGDYDRAARKITFKLRSGLKLEAEYYENYMTEITLAEFDRAQDEAEGAGQVQQLHRVYCKHLSLALHSLPVEIGGSRIADDTPEARVKILQRFSWQDLRFMVAQIGEDLSRPLDEDEMDSSSGPDTKAS